MTQYTSTPYFPANLEDYAPWVAKHGLHAPYGKCQCGCGQKAPPSKWTSSKRRGLTKGLPLRYVPGHQKRLPPSDGRNPGGSCMCGCGQKTPVARKTCKEKGWVKGKPISFIPGHAYTHPLAERFWGKVTVGGSDDCWLWTAKKDIGGYGKIAVKGKHTKASRVAWVLTHGEIPQDMFICHHCDNPACVNPHHLFLGTHLDNMRDMREKERNPSGEKCWQAKLDKNAVIEIRELWAKGMNLSDLGRRFGVAPATIRDVVQFKTWRHIS